MNVPNETTVLNSDATKERSAAQFQVLYGNKVHSNANNEVKLLMEINSNTTANTDKTALQNSKKQPVSSHDPWTLQKVVVTFAMGTSAHGFANSVRLWRAGYKYCSAALVLTAIFMPVTGFLFGFIGMQDMVRADYYDTQIKVISDKHDGLALPRILMSNSGIFNYSALAEYNVSRYEASLLTALLVGKFAYTPTLEANIDQVNTDYHSLLQRLNTSAWGVWNLLSYKCHEVIIECLFNNKHIPGPICCKEHFDTVLGSFGLSFLSKTAFIQEREEVAAGLTLSLRVPVQALDLDWDYMNRDATLLKAGLRVSIIDNSKDFSAGSSSVVPVLGLDRILVTLSYFQHDNTGLYQSLFPWLDSSADCTPADAPFQQQASVGGNCVVNSLHVCADHLRNCNFVSYPFWNGKDRFCDFKDQVTMIHSEEAAQCYNEHITNCGHLCQEDIYRFSAQSCPLLQFNDVQDEKLKSNWSQEGAFTMFYTHLGHTSVTQSRADLVKLLSSLGGTMGLFMGASMITLGEMTTVLIGMVLWAVTALAKKYSIRGCYCTRH